MDIINGYKDLKKLLSVAKEADFSMLQGEFHTPFATTGALDTFLGDSRVFNEVEKITLPCTVVPRYAHVESMALSHYLGIGRTNLGWILRTRYCVSIIDGKTEISSLSDMISGEGEEKEYHTGAEGVLAAYDAIDPFEEAYALETRAFDPTLEDEDYDYLRSRAAVVARVANGELCKDDFFLNEIPVLPMVTKLAEGDITEFSKCKIAQLTYRLWHRARRLDGILKMTKPVPRMIVINEKRMLQQAADRLLAEYIVARIRFEAK